MTMLGANKECSSTFIASILHTSCTHNFNPSIHITNTLTPISHSCSRTDANHNAKFSTALSVISQSKLPIRYSTV